MLFSFSTANAVAQNANSEKILGCWILKKIEFNTQNDFSEDFNQQAQNSVVCFNSDGKFTTTKAGNSAVPINGSYKILDDGKTVTQKKALADESVEEDAEIEFLDDKHLIFKIEFGSMYFDRK